MKRLFFALALTLSACVGAHSQSTTFKIEKQRDDPSAEWSASKSFITIDINNSQVLIFDDTGVLKRFEIESYDNNVFILKDAENSVKMTINSYCMESHELIVKFIKGNNIYQVIIKIKI